MRHGHLLPVSADFSALHSRFYCLLRDGVLRMYALAQRVCQDTRFCQNHAWCYFLNEAKLLGPLGKQLGPYQTVQVSVSQGRSICLAPGNSISHGYLQDVVLNRHAIDHSNYPCRQLICLRCAR